MAQQPPPELLAAIEKSSLKYHVPVDLEVGIWRVESGGRFPNPFVNPSGYGGLFGTKNWNAPTQQQADYSESILAGLLKKSGGNVADALHAYSGGGYSAVPGETTFGVIGGFHPGGGGLFPGVGSFLTKLPGGNILFGSGPGGVQGGIATGTVPPTPSWLGGTESLVLRGLLILAGAVVVIVGLFLVAHSLGARKVPAAVSTAASAIPQRRLERRYQASRRATGGPARRERISQEPTPVYRKPSAVKSTPRPSLQNADAGDEGIPF